MTTDGIDLINEDNARSVFLALLEQITHAARANAYEHFDEVRTGDREERHISFAGDGARKQRLAGSGRAHHHNALGNSPAQLLKLLRLFQELNDLLKLFLGLFDTGDVFEGHALLLIAQELRARLAKRESLVAARLHLAHHENPQANEHEQRRVAYQPEKPLAGRAALE